MNFTSPRRRFARAAVAGLALTGLLSACGGSGSGDKASSGPVTLPFWGWANGQDAVVKAFNAAHKDVKLKYTKVTDQLTMQKQLTNAVKAGNAPCLVQNTAEYVTTWVSQGALADISKYVSADKDKFNAGSWASAQVQGKSYGVPTSSAPAFTIYRTDVFKKYGLKAPTTWDEFIAAGKVLKKHGIKITNYAGEDPSTLEILSMQAGAHWYAIDGNSWKVDFQDAGSLKAAQVIQDVIDNDLNSKLSFADYAAVQRNYDNGGTVTRQISTWQMAGMVQNFTKSDGKWALSPWPTFAGEAAKTPAGTNQSGGVTLVTKQCAHQQQAAEAALWMSTNTGAVKTMASPTTGNGVMPAAGRQQRVRRRVDLRQAARDELRAREEGRHRQPEHRHLGLGVRPGLDRDVHRAADRLGEGDEQAGEGHRSAGAHAGVDGQGPEDPRYQRQGLRRRR